MHASCIVTTVNGTSSNCFCMEIQNTYKEEEEKENRRIKNKPRFLTHFKEKGQIITS